MGLHRLLDLHTWIFNGYWGNRAWLHPLSRGGHEHGRVSFPALSFAVWEFTGWRAGCQEKGCLSRAPRWNNRIGVRPAVFAVTSPPGDPRAGEGLEHGSQDLQDAFQHLRSVLAPHSPPPQTCSLLDEAKRNAVSEGCRRLAGLHPSASRGAASPTLTLPAMSPWQVVWTGGLSRVDGLL